MKKYKGHLMKKKGMTINWNCIIHSCPCKMRTIDGVVMPDSNDHNHDPTIEQWHKRVGRAKLKSTVSVSVFGIIPYNIYMSNNKYKAINNVTQKMYEHPSPSQESAMR